jgi:DNA polymerase II small subunit
MKVIASKNGPVIGLTKELIEDEVIGLNLTKSGRWFFVNNIVFPDIPTKPIKSCSDDCNAVFISDTHIGSDIFLPQVFQKFIDWLKCENGSAEQKKIASKVRYLFFIGDLVDGVGVYPGQEEELEIKDIYKQYECVASYLNQIPNNIKIIVCPGNHDALRISLPQHPLNNNYSSPINKLSNVISVSNPAFVNIGYSNSFPGFDVLMYHGNSFDYFVHNVPYLRQTGYERPDLIMEFLLRKRHLCPTHGSTLIAPSLSDDHLIIDNIPDIFASGHIHQSFISQYKGIITMNTSCFQAQSDFMKRVGVNPKPGKIPIFNFKTKKTSILNFME